MNNIKNFVNEKSSRMIINALCTLDFAAVQKLSADSKYTVYFAEVD